MEISIFLIGLLFGFSSGVAIMSVKRTGIEIDERQKIVEELEKRERIIATQKAIIKDLRRGTK